MAARVGILALQGNVAAHRRVLEQLGCAVVEVRKAFQLSGLDALVLPGGESSVFLKLLDQELKAALIERISSGLPTLATCAGVILLAREVRSPEQESLKLLDVVVERNAYGRQLESFVIPQLDLTDAGKEIFSPALEGVFIRAPKFLETGKEVQILASHQGCPVLVSEGNIIAASFHPEKSQDE